MVQVTVLWSRELEGSEANVVEGFVVDTEGLVRVLDQLVNGEGSVVWLDDGIRDLRGRGGEKLSVQVILLLLTCCSSPLAKA